MSKSARLKINPARTAKHESNPLPLSPAWWHWIIPPFIISGLAALFYYPSLHYSFQFDDVANIQKFYNIRHGTFKTLFLQGPRWISYWLNAFNYSIGKFDPFIYRLFNVSFHLSTSILIFYSVFRALSRLKKQESFFSRHALAIAYTTAFLFALHPVQTQTISYVIQGQLEGLAGLCIMASMMFFLIINQTQNSFTKFLATILLFVVAFLGCGTKEIMIVAPALILLVDWFFVAQGDWNSLKKRTWLHVSLFSLVGCMYLYFLKPTFFKDLIGFKMEARNNIGNVLTENPGEKILPMHFFISQFKVILHYVIMFIWPFNISVEYDWKLVKDFFAPDCLLPLLILLGLIGFLLHLFKKDNTNPIIFCFAWFFIAIAPRSSFIPSSELLADYKTYIASFGILLLLASGLVKLVTMLLDRVNHESAIPVLGRHQMQFALLTILALPIGYSTRKRNQVWRSSEEFWSNIIQNAPDKARAYNNLGVALSEQGKMNESIPYYKKAIGMDRFYPDPWNNLAVAYSVLGKFDLAIDTMKQAIKIYPNYPEGYNNLASFLIQKKSYPDAEKVLGIALQLRPYYGKAYFNLGKLHLEQGNHEKAFECFKAACTKGDLDNESGFTIYANISLSLKKYDDAIFAFTKLLEIKPGAMDIAFNLANAYFLGAHYPEAIQLYLKLSTINPNDGRIWFNLGEAHIYRQEPAKALEFFIKAKNTNFSTPNLDLRIASCLEQTGNIDEALKVLHDYMQKQNIPDQFKHLAMNTIAQLNHKRATAT